MSNYCKVSSFEDLLKCDDNYLEKKEKTPRHLFDIGQITTIQAFKYDGTLYRQYEGVKIIANLDDFVVLLLMKTKVAERTINWVVSEPILFFFAKNKFYNASITLNKKKDNYIYINLASPFYIDNSIIKYIDFDIDVKSYLDKEFNVVDWPDFKNSIVQYNYPLELIYRMYEELDFLFEQHKTKNGVFSKKLVDGLVKMLVESGDI
ncbi:Protein of uncharacterised function (DUF402) [Metamycoplasma cloacale]|uniref:DUF402 domain-containing protein n=1 Tax=Metamycoplasma cloacale TaxID=92401 RepID=A0A2Z4LNX2_9BACT|nr:DUF402 domain-containing protein [Metamycoplasma cloacale]AWX42957.1 DUF402 domain-containing protein [Metamycoplasma cloacale]VEU79219.1 Protein of uncharacterised function (DUF402) [Metamycoplasma cloacale]